MKILTATSNGQGVRDNDFDHAIEGELVWIGFTCARDRDDPDGGCGCGRAFAGLNSHRATTTAMVRDLPLDRDDLLLALAAYEESAGYACDHERYAAELEREVDDVIEIVSAWHVGDVIERRLDVLGPRLLGQT